MKIAYNKTAVWNLLLLLIRIWLGYRMITASYSSVTGILSSPKEREFFIKWFGTELHYPMPLFMAFLAKGSELAGGIFLIGGLFTRVAASLVAFTMFMATVTANLGADFNIDGGFTISYTLFALIFIVWGGGKYSLDNIFWAKKTNKASSKEILVV